MGKRLAGTLLAVADVNASRFLIVKHALKESAEDPRQ